VPKTKRAQGAPRFLYPLTALPGVAWLLLFFIVPVYSVMAVAFGGVDPFFNTPQPAWNPLQWQYSTFNGVVQSAVSGPLRPVFERTFWYVLLSLALCVLIGYPVAYYVARLAGRRRGLLLVLLLAPWWINYLTRMLAWVNLLQKDGYVDDALSLFHLARVDWLGGNWYTVVIGLVYGYLPFFIIPLYATLDRIDQRLLEASRDLGVGSVRTFLHVTLPLSRLGLITATVITALPMFGDYYTNQLVSGSPKTTMVGNQIELFLLEGPQKDVGACMVLLLTLLLLVLMAYYLVLTRRATREAV
jgi:ABC-type spermidine/putrescine transport system permease subunit I